MFTRASRQGVYSAVARPIKIIVPFKVRTDITPGLAAGVFILLSRGHLDL